MPRLGRHETERAECLHSIFHLLADRILFALRNQSQSRVGCHAPLNKVVPVLDSDECDAVRTGIPVSSRNISWIALKSLDGSAEITCRGSSFHIRTPFAIGLDTSLRFPAFCATAALQDPRYGLKARGSGSQ